MIAASPSYKHVPASGESGIFDVIDDERRRRFCRQARAWFRRPRRTARRAAPIALRPCRPSAHFTQATFAKVERMVAGKWKLVGRRFSVDDKDELVGLVMLRIVEWLPTLPPGVSAVEAEKRIVGRAREIADNAIADLLTGTRRLSKEDGVAPGLAALTTGPNATAYADDTDDPEEARYTQGRRGSIPRTRRGTVPTTRNSVGEVPSEDTVIADIDAERAKAKAERRPASESSNEEIDIFKEYEVEIDITSENFLRRSGLGK